MAVAAALNQTPPGKFYVNGTAAIGVNFKNSSGVDANPTTVTFKTLDPFGAELDYVYGTDSEVTRPSTGNYTATVTPDSAGRWAYRWEATGTGTAVTIEGTFLVQDSCFYPWDLSQDYVP